MKCNVCKKRTEEFLVETGIDKKLLIFKWKQDRHIPLCRDHLIKYFKKAFLNARQKMIVFCPNLDGKEGVYQYLYFTKEILGNYTPEPKTNDSIVSLMDEWLESITETCEKCSSDAGVAYFNEHSIPYEYVPGYMGGFFNYPMIHKVNDRPEILCRPCAFRNISHALRAGTKGFKEGIFIPNKDNKGVYLAFEI